MAPCLHLGPVKIGPMRIQAPRGTDDLLPSQSHRWIHLENEFRALTSLYGYREVRTPTFEEIELFIRTSGETSDIVSKEMYDFYDKGERHVCLKPEGTAGVARAVVEHSLCPQGQVARLSYITPIFRYGRPQKGRLREAHQVGLELMGSASPTADAEVIEITAKFYERIGIQDVEVQLNSIGRAECRARYREVVLSHFAPYLADCAEEERAKAEKNPLRLLDSKDPKAAELAKTVPPILNYLEDESKANFETLQQLLNEAKVPYKVMPDIVRGLDYYTDTVFEVLSTKLGAQSSLCGGGRYDNLVKELGGPATPSVGVAMGIERAMIVLEESGIEWPAPRPAVFVVQATEDAAQACRAITRDLRAAGLETQIDLDGKKMGNQMKQADRAGAKFVAMIGTDELAADAVLLRNLESGDQVSVPRANLVKEVQGRL